MATGVALAAVAAAAAGAYFFGTEAGAKNRKQIGVWKDKAMTEVQKEIKKGKVVSKQAYHKAIMEVMARYKQAKNIHPEEVNATIAEMKKHWAGIERDVKKHTAAITKSAVKTFNSGAKKATKKAAKKAAKKRV